MGPRKPLLTAEEVAELVHLEPRTVLKLAREGSIRRVKIGHKTVRFEPDAVDDFIRRRRQNGHNGKQRPLFDPATEGMPGRF